MYINNKFYVAFLLLALFFLALDSHSAHAQPATNTDAQSVRRFEQILKTRPQEGTALDKFYDSINRSGGLEDYLEKLRIEASEKKQSTLYQLLGLLLNKRGDVEAAVEAYRKAIELKPTDASIYLHLAKSQVLSRKESESLQSLEAMLSHKPTATMVLETIRMLPRFSRLPPNAAAIGRIGERIESGFRGNISVLRGLADALIESDLPDQALSVLEPLVKHAKPQDEVPLRIKLADVKRQLGQTEESLAQLEFALSKVNPDSWLSDSIWGRIDRLVESQGGPARLVEYYQARLKVEQSAPQRAAADVKLLLRLASMQIRLEQVDSARQSIALARQAAPTAPEPLLLLEELQATERDYSAAAESMKQLVDIQPKNIDFRVRWGRYVSLILDNPVQRQREAADIWRPIATDRPEDAAMAVKVAELFQGIGMSEDAVEFFRQALAVSKKASPYREYLGEYLHRLGRQQEALEVLLDLPEEEQNAESYEQLSQTLLGLRFREPALRALIRACELKPTTDNLIRCAVWMREAGQHEEALRKLSQAFEIAERAHEFAKIWKEQSTTLPMAGELKPRIERLEIARLQLAKDPSATSADRSKVYQELAVLQLANGDASSAVDAARHATEQTPDRVQAWMLAAYVYRASNMPVPEFEANSKLADLDPRNRLEHLQRNATLAMQLRQLDQAVQLAESLLREPGAGPQQFKFFLAICAETRRRDQGIKALQTYLDSRPKDATLRLLLARSQFEDDQISEAIESTWQALHQSPSREFSQECLQYLIDGYRRNQKLAELPEKLRAFGLENERQKDSAFWIARVQQELGDLNAAWQSIERTLAQFNDDIELMRLAVDIASRSRKLDAAADLQRKINRMEPTLGGLLKLGELLVDADDLDGAAVPWREALSQRNQASPMIRYVRELISRDRFKVAGSITKLAMEVASDNWELIALGIVANQQAGQAEQAVRTAEHILALDIPYDTRARTKQDIDDASGEEYVVTAEQAGNEFVEVSRLSWLDRADQWQAIFHTFDSGRSFIRLTESISVVSRNAAIQQLAMQRGAAVRPLSRPSLYLSTFADAHALAILTKYGSRNTEQLSTRAEQLQFLERCAQSQDKNALWDAMLILQPLAVWSQDEDSWQRKLFVQCLDALAAMNDPEAIQLALNDIVGRRAMQFQMSQRVSTRLKPMESQTLERFESLLNRCYELVLDHQLYFDLLLSKELREIGKIEASEARFERGLVKSRDISEIAKASQEFLPAELDVATRILLRGWEVHRVSILEAPHVDASFTLIAMFDDAWHRDGKRLGDRTRGFLNILRQILEMHGDALEQPVKARFVWDQSTRLQYARQFSGGDVHSVSADFFRPSPIIPATLLTAARYMAGVINASELPTENLQQFVELAGGPSATPNADSRPQPGRTLVHATIRAMFMWWARDNQAALDAMAIAEKTKIATNLTLLGTAQMMVHSGKPNEAIGLVSALQVDSESMLVDQLLILLAAHRAAGDKQSAEGVEDRLTRLPLSMRQREQFIGASSGAMK